MLILLLLLGGLLSLAGHDRIELDRRLAGLLALLLLLLGPRWVVLLLLLWMIVLQGLLVQE